MKVNIFIKYAREFAKQNKQFEHYVGLRFWSAREEDTAEIDISMLTIEELKDFYEYLKLKLNTGDQSVNGAVQRVVAYITIKTAPSKHVVKNLNELAAAMKEYIAENSDRRWLFKMADDNMKLPYLVTSIIYYPAEHKQGGYVEPARTEVCMTYCRLDDIKKLTMSFHDNHLRADSKSMKLNRLNVQQLLERMGYMVGIESIQNEYDAEIEIFLKYRNQLGEQFTASGIGYTSDRYDGYSSKVTLLNTDGLYHKLVIDEPSSRKINGDSFVGAGFWEKDKDATFRVPVHPYVRMFNLRTHTNLSVHTSTLTEYKYTPDLMNKLILDDDVKELVEILGNGTREGLGDIIKGKAEGIIVGCVGPSGLGKSLTAEIYSEFLRRPLYTVQCSQLGTDPDKLEKNLVEVLNRAGRWRAVLLLDEADVYIRARGEDLVQNAIVGVFLRVLEYYPGILFLTSNVINLDDAIESRFTAKIVYKYPTPEQLKEIWAIQLEGHGWESKKYSSVVDQMIEKYPVMAGRDIRSILKLATLLCRFRKEDITYDVLMHASKFGTFDKEKKLISIAEYTETVIKRKSQNAKG